MSAIKEAWARFVAVFKKRDLDEAFYGRESEIDPGHPEIHAALTAAAVFRQYSQAFVILSMHEQPLYRILKDASKSLEDLKAKRIAARQSDLDAAVALHNLNKTEGVPFEPQTAGFVFKTEFLQQLAASPERSAGDLIAGDLVQSSIDLTRRQRQTTLIKVLV